MAIALDASSQSVYGASPNTWSHTCTGANLVLFITTVTDNDSVTAVTYNGVAAALIVKGTYNSAIRKTTALYYLANPATGTNTVSITTTGENAGGGAVSYTGASQTGIPDSFNTTADDTAQASYTISTNVVASDCWLVASLCDDQGAGETAGAGATIRQQTAQGMVLYDSNGTVGTGSQSMTINFSPNARKSGVIASFKPAGAVAATSTLLTTLNAG